MDERCAICGRRGTNGAGPSQDAFVALSDRHINKIVIALNKLSPPQRQAVAQSV
jgi:hypothetical protein